jgi:Tol biopolymer transport system component
VFASRRNGTFALYRMDPDGSRVGQITDPRPPYSDARPTVSRDGKTIVFNRESVDTIGIFTAELR